MRGTTLTRIWLLFVAAYPAVVGTLQIIHYLSLLFEWELTMEIVHCLALYSPPILGIFYVVSLRERFCVYHRLCLVSTFLVNINGLWTYGMSPVLANSLTTIFAAGILVGIVGSLIHFTYQIQDFIRYVRIESKKQDSH